MGGERGRRADAADMESGMNDQPATNKRPAALQATGIAGAADRESARVEARALFEAAKRANDRESADRLSLRALEIATEWNL